MSDGPDKRDEMFQPITTMRAHEAVVAQIEQMVLTEELHPHSRLPSERDMMKQFGVSRSTIREALRVVEANGLIRVRQGEPGGALVTATPSLGLARTIGALLRADQGNLADIVELRMLIEGFAVYTLANQQPQSDLQPLEEAVQLMKAATSDQELRDADALFHLREAECCSNTLLTLVARGVREAVATAISAFVTSRSDDVAALIVQHHEDLLRAMRDHDGTRATYLAQTSLITTYGPMVSGKERLRLEAVLEFGPHADGDG